MTTLSRKDKSPSRQLTELIVAEEHSQLYDLWLERGSRNLAVCHVDFHCDMRGLLIDRRLGRACFVDRHVPYVHRLDSGSYLTHAVMNGVVTKLRWVHDSVGGRTYDYQHCVKYETDPSALPYRVLGRRPSVPVSFVEHTFDDWGGPLPGEFLDIDWDAIAHADYNDKKIRRLMAEILEREFNPHTVFLAFSPGYCNPDRRLFEEFIEGLEAKFTVQARRLPPYRAAPHPASTFWNLYRRVDHSVLKQLHRFGIY